MKIISLNTFAGRFFEPLIEFVKSESATTDFFCFQEVMNSKLFKEFPERRANLFDEFAEILPDFAGYFALAQESYVHSRNVPGVDEGIAIFVKKTHEVQKTGDFFIRNFKNSSDFKDHNTYPNNIQFIQLKLNNKLLTVCNLYGTSMPGTKLDTPERLEQTRKVLNFTNSEPGEKIIVGDFNLLPHTRSITMFEDHGFSNLIKTFKIKTTRGSLIRKLHPEYEISPGVWQEFADYALVTSGISVSNFAVPDLPISDHLPLIAEFSLI